MKIYPVPPSRSFKYSYIGRGARNLITIRWWTTTSPWAWTSGPIWWTWTTCARAATPSSSSLQVRWGRLGSCKQTNTNLSNCAIIWQWYSISWEQMLPSFNLLIASPPSLLYFARSSSMGMEASSVRLLTSSSSSSKHRNINLFFWTIGHAQN